MRNDQSDVCVENALKLYQFALIIEKKKTKPYIII